MARRDTAIRRCKLPQDGRGHGRLSEAAFEENDPAVVAAALGDIARQGDKVAVRPVWVGVAVQSAVARGNPELATVMKVVRRWG